MQTYFFQCDVTPFIPDVRPYLLFVKCDATWYHVISNLFGETSSRIMSLNVLFFINATSRTLELIITGS